ncbi:MAG: Spy/CpxP family protein refolding chaperone [Burkholderiales bacterium]|nr:Spy/CpxP family protein refolding chaperone [Ferrovum sp.]
MRTNPIKRMFLVAGSVLLLQAGPLLAADAPATAPSSPSQGAWTGAAHPPIDWVQHTHRMLDELKTKLNLSGSQKQAWDVWSEAVLKNASSQSERINHWRDAHMKQGFMGDPAHSHMSTPDRMAHGLEHMRMEIKRMQDHVALLEAAQAGTKIFYDALDTNQKTIFDLYWQQSYQEGWGGHGMMEHEGCGPMGHGSNY